MKGLMFCLLSVLLAPLLHAQSLATLDNTRVAALVPADLSPMDACNGLGGLAQCSAALHVAQNLNIPFIELRRRLIAGQSLAGAIHALAPTADARRAAERAERQARADLAARG